jgi:hypothetical protein
MAQAAPSLPPLLSGTFSPIRARNFVIQEMEYVMQMEFAFVLMGGVDHSADKRQQV